jgi:flagellar protein FliS
MSNVFKLQAYQRNQLTTTDSGTVLLMLYQGAIDSVQRARQSMEQGDMAEKGKHILRANDIVSQFMASLDYDIGGELAQNLEGLYRYMLDQMLLANVKNDPKLLEIVASLLITLKQGWEEAVATQRKKVAQGQV